jgi:molybdopterin biosynthesis enzyme
MRWMQVAIRPAKPLAFGVVTGPGGAGGDEDPAPRRVPVFGLPGNPVSSLVSFELFARPALRRLAGHPEGRWHRAQVAAVADEPLRRRPDGKTHFVRVEATVDGDGTLHVRSSGGQGSHQLAAMAQAEALAVVADGEGVPAGGTVPLLLLRDLYR